MSISVGLVHEVTAIDSFQIAEPIKGLFQPRFELCEVGYHVLPSLKLTIKAKDSTDPTRLIDVALVKPVERRVLERPEALASFMRGMLHELVMHEIDESILWNGQRVFDPHVDRQTWASVGGQGYSLT